MVSTFKRQLVRVRNHLFPRLLQWRLRPHADSEMVRLGSSYGGWWVPRSCLREGVIAYCAGAGEDISFDLELLKAGCSVTTFDPTPRSIHHVEVNRPDSDRFRFVPIGWWNVEDTLRFYAPRDQSHVSHSIVNLQRTEAFFEAPVKPVHALMLELGDSAVDLIKMDIEGAEHVVLESLLENGPLPGVLCVEFDQPQPVARILLAAGSLKEHGYHVAMIEGWNFTFIRSGPARLASS